jgi:hypothetical protein
MDFLREGSSAEGIVAELHLTEEQVCVALDYIAAHRRIVEAEYAKILQRVQQRNPPHVEAGRATSPDALKQRIRARRIQDITSRMLILADNDVGGAVTALRRILESEEWAEFSATLALRFAEFADVSLARDASDRVVWQTCQEVGQC